MPQFDRDETCKPVRKNIEIGLAIFSIGLFKKVILSQYIAGYSTPAFDAADSGAGLSMLEYWLGACAFALQVYFDFSGYTDMAIGSARLFGIKLPINFYSPFKSLNTSEFWRRWHMTLTRLITALVFTPLSIARARSSVMAGRGPGALFWSSVAFPTVITFMLVGIWHGAGWNFLIFGFLQGVFIVINILWRNFRKNQLGHKLKSTTLPGRFLARAVTTLGFFFSMAFFRAETTSGAMEMAKSMLGLGDANFAITAIPDARFLVLIAAYGFIIFLLPNTQQLFDAYSPSLESPRKQQVWGLEKLRWQPSGVWALVGATMFTFSLMNMNSVSEFIYFQF